MSVAGYPDYTDSGVEWVGLMPAHWEVKRLRYCASLVTIKATESDWQIGLENIAGWTGRFVETEAEFAGDGTAFERSDILYGKLRPYLAKVLVAERPGQAVGDFHVLRPRPTSMSAFLARQLLTRELVSRIDGSTHGSKMPRASWETLADISLPVPPLPEQIAIATFLDRETGKIDALVEEQRRLIALLKEKRQAVISHAVTKGLNPNAPMKDSGIEWLGEVPAHWEVKRLRFVASLNPSKSQIAEIDRTTELSFLPMDAVGEDGSLRLDETRSIQTVETGYTFFAEGDVTYAKITPCFENGKGAIMRYLTGGFGFGTTELTVLRAKKEIASPDFLHWLVCSLPFRSFGEGAMYGAGGQKRVPDDFTRDFASGFPPIVEQNEIVSFIANETRRIDELMEQAKLGKTLLQERRAALISAAVTGKIDVRDMTSNLLEVA